MKHGSLRSAARFGLFMVAWTLSAVALRAQNENETVGFRTNHVFEGGAAGENIDILNGGLNLSMPIGQSYQINSTLGYGLKLAYSSKVWDTSDFHQDPTHRSEEIMPFNEGPTGIGFAMHLGRIYVDVDYVQDCDPVYFDSCWTKTWYWVPPDGTPHEITVQNHRKFSGYRDPEPPWYPIPRVTGDLGYVKVSGPDDSLCSTPAKTKCFKVETPDGLIYTLEKQNEGTSGFRSDCVAERVSGVESSNTITPTERRDSQNYCGWYTAAIEDPSVGTRTGSSDPLGRIAYPNHIFVTYDTRANFKHAISLIEDSAGRVINVRNCEWAEGQNGARGSGNVQGHETMCLAGSKPFAGSTYAAASRHAVATYEVELPSFGGSMSPQPGARTFYRFAYEFYRIKRANPEFENCCGNPLCTSCTLYNSAVLKLVRIDYPEPSDPPDQYSMYFGYASGGDIDTGPDYGEVACRTLPMRRMAPNGCYQHGDHSVVKYYFGYYSYMPSYISYEYLPQFDAVVPSGNRTGVTRQLVVKELHVRAGIISGSWFYNRDVSTSLTNPTSVVVTDPFGNDTVHYFYGSRSSGSPDVGLLPEDGYAPEWNDGLNYRIDYYQGWNEMGALIRSELREYDSDPYKEDGRYKSKRNVREKRIVTQFHDDADRESITSRDGWDDHGHWQTEVEVGFDLPRPRTTRTDYYTGSAVYRSDLLRLREVSDSDGVHARTDNEYLSSGKLKTSIERSIPPGRAGTVPAPFPIDSSQIPGDVMTSYTYSSTSGNAMTKVLSTGRAGDPTYSIKYSYGPKLGNCTVDGECGGYLAAKEFMDGTQPRFKSIDRDRDANTGLIFATRDTIPLRTLVSYSYDVLGRLTQIAPAGEEMTIIRYPSLVETAVQQGTAGTSDLDPGANFVLTRYRYDGMGRLTATLKRPPDPDPTKGYACQRTQHDALGRVTYQTEWTYDPVCAGLPPAAEIGCPGACKSSCWAEGIDPEAVEGTEFDLRDPVTAACDPFGRVRMQVPTDADRVTKDKVTTTRYFGTSQEVTTYGVRGPGSIPFPSKTAFLKDSLGRLIAVDSSSDSTCSTAGGACSSSSDCPDNEPCVAADGGADAYYEYDALDRLVRVRLSDNLGRSQERTIAYDGLGRLASTGNPESGVTIYSRYDALGNLLSTQDAQGNQQRFTYDFAGRPKDQLVVRQGESQERVVARNYYDEQGFPGKLTSIESRDELGNLILTERRFYDAIGARLSSSFHFFNSWPSDQTQVATYTYNTRGEVESLTYPRDYFAIRTGLTVDFAYKNGSAVSVTQRGGVQLGRVTYNPAGSIEKVDMPGGGRTSIDFDSRNRPKKISAGVWNGTGFNATPSYQSGTYEYDGAGNIYQIGDSTVGRISRYGYDAANRLVSAHTEYLGQQFDEVFAYDVFGNMTARTLTNLLTGIIEADNFTIDGTAETNRVASRDTTTRNATHNNPGPAVLHLYDSNGNMRRGGRSFYPDPQPGGSLTQDLSQYQYGALNRLLKILKVGGPSADGMSDAVLSEAGRFEYDASGNRILKRADDASVAIFYLRDPSGRVLSEFRMPWGQGASLEWSSDYVYLAGRLLALKENLKPGPPKGLQIRQTPQAMGRWTLTLTWAACSEQDTVGYSVYRKQIGLNSDFVLVATPSGPSLSEDYFWSAGVTVQYRIACRDSQGYESEKSAVVSIVTGDTSAPSVPALSKVEGDRSITLTYSSTTSGAGLAGFKIYRGLASNSQALLTTELVVSTTFVDVNLRNGITYYYKVKAIDTLGNESGFSSVLSATPKDLTPPSSPRDLKAVSSCGSASSAERVSLSWKANTTAEGVSLYEVYVNSAPTFEGLSPLTTTTGTTVEDTTARTPGVDYYYAVRAVDGASPGNRSALSSIVRAATRGTGSPPKVQIFASASDGQVEITWQPADPSTFAWPQRLLLYRKQNATEGCGNYVLMGSKDVLDVNANGQWVFPDSTVENNVAYDYAVTGLVNGVESSFSKPTLALPLDRPTGPLYQCNSGGGSGERFVQWKPPAARFYQPYRTDRIESKPELGFLKGYHLFIHQICEPPFGTLQDMSPTRPVVVNNLSSIDPYLVDPTSDFTWFDPKGIVDSSTRFSTPDQPDVFESPFGTCTGSNPGFNCALPKATYKIYAEGTWLTADSGWPSYFDALHDDQFMRCSDPLKVAVYFPSCTEVPASSPRFNPNIVPPPTRVTASPAGPGEIRLEWVAPVIQEGKPKVAGYYLYARKSNDRRSFKSPLPFAIKGPGDDHVTLSGLASAAGPIDFSVSVFDEAGQVSQAGSNRCEESGTNCSGAVCPTNVCANTRKPCANTLADCSYGYCSESGLSCPSTGLCPAGVCSNAKTTSSCSPLGLVNNDYGMNSGALSVSVGIPSPTNGNSLIAVIGTRGNTDSRVKSITQSGVTNWQRAAQKTNGSGVTTEIWYAAGVNNAGRQVTVTLEQSLRASVVVAEYTGVLLSPGPLDRWSLGNSGSSPNASTGSTTAATQQNYELYIGAIANIDDSVVYSNWTSTFTKVRESSSAGGVAGDRNKTVLFDSLATSMGTPSMSATLTPAKPWAGVIVTFRTVASEASQCPGASGDACLPQACVPDSCVRESCEESIGRWCQNKSPATACTVSTDCRPEWDDGSCNISQTPCDPDLTGQCPTGQVCVPGDRCINLENSAVASPGANPIQPAAPGSLKIIPWTINDKIVGRGRKGIKIAWTAPGGSTVITGFRVYRGTSPDGPFCALLDGGGATPPLPQEVSGLCVGDVPPSERTVDQDAYNQDLSSPYITTGLPALQFYWDRTVANERIYYYRVSQIEGMLETPFEATHQIWGQQLGYDKDTLPPPQGFKAWASQVGNLTDKQGIVLKWCPVCAPNVANPPCAQTASDLPTLTEYRVYRTGRKKGNMRLLARLDPTCLLPNKRCEITRSEIPGGNACVTSGNLPRLDPVTREPSCAKITPMTGTCNNTTGPRCGIVDQTFTCWPQTTALIKPYQYYNNYSYLVTALHQDASGLWTESMPSNENQGWLNYCAIGTNECAPDTMCNPRRDPDGDGEYLICGDEDAQLYSPDADWTPSDEQIADAWVWPASDDGEAPDDLVAPHRTIGQTIPPDPPARFLFYHLDHLGSPRLILDAAGVKVSEHNYLPFGEEKSPQPDPSLNNRGFTGHQRDQETGLDYMVARYYSSSLGRFMAVDPGEDSALEDPQSWNKYAYVRNNPLRSIDPDGTNLWDLFKKLYNYVDQQTGGALSQSLVILGDQPIDPEPAAEAVEAAESLSGAVDATTGAGTNAPKEVVVDAAKHPESAAHIQDAQAAGQPSTLTVDRGGAQGRRQEALGDTPTQPGKDRDEYPPAMFQEGGQGASVRPVSPSDNRGAGACIGNQCRELADGAKVEVKVKEKDKK